LIDAAQLLPGQHPFYAAFQIVRFLYATAGVQTTQQWWQIRRQVCILVHFTSAKLYR
jgi:hypothetical protein